MEQKDGNYTEEPIGCGEAVGSSSLVDSMRSVAGQMEEPEEDVSRFADLQRAALVVSVLLDKAGLVCGATLYGHISKNKKQSKTIYCIFTSCCYHNLWFMNSLDQKGKVKHQ